MGMKLTKSGIWKGPRRDEGSGYCDVESMLATAQDPARTGCACGIFRRGKKYEEEGGRVRERVSDRDRGDVSKSECRRREKGVKESPLTTEFGKCKLRLSERREIFVKKTDKLAMGWGRLPVDRQGRLGDLLRNDNDDTR
jgi:hypothetical protein